MKTRTISKPPVKQQRICGIYQIRCTKNDRLYIGQSVHIARRWQQHIDQLDDRSHSNALLSRDWQKYGANVFEFEVIEECRRGSLDDRENHWILRSNAFYNVLWANGQQIKRDRDWNIIDTAPATATGYGVPSWFICGVLGAIVASILAGSAAAVWGAIGGVLFCNVFWET